MPAPPPTSPMADSKARISPQRHWRRRQPPEQGQATGTAVTSTEPAVAGVLRPGGSPLARLHSKAKPTLRSEGPAIARIFSRRTIATPPRAGRVRLRRQRSGNGARPKSPTSTEREAALVATLDAIAVPAAATAPVAAAVSAAIQPAASTASFDAWSLPAPTAAVTPATLAPTAATQPAAALSAAALSVGAPEGEQPTTSHARAPPRVAWRAIGVEEGGEPIVQVEPIVTRHEPLTGTMQVLAVKRRLTSEWSLPGGMVQAGEPIPATLMRMMGLEPSGGGSGSASGTSGGGGGGSGGSSGGGGGGESSEQARRFKEPAEQKDFDDAVQALLQSGVVVYTGFVDDQRSTDNAWVESRVVHFHCPRELGEVLPLPQPGGKLRGKLRGRLGGRLGGRLRGEAASRQSMAASTAEVHACWLDADRAIEPRYAEMRGRDWVERALAAHAKVAEVRARVSVSVSVSVRVS